MWAKPPSFEENNYKIDNIIQRRLARFGVGGECHVTTDLTKFRKLTKLQGEKAGQLWETGAIDLIN